VFTNATKEDGTVSKEGVPLGPRGTHFVGKEIAAGKKKEGVPRKVKTVGGGRS